MIRFLLFIGMALLLPSLCFGQNRGISIQGQVLDAQSKELLTGATISFTSLKRYMSTNEQARFTYTSKQDTLTLKVSFIGYKEQTHFIHSDTLLTILLQQAPITGEAVEVVGTTLPIHQKTQISSIRLTPLEIEQMPMYMGQSDILKAFQFYPGVQPGIEGTAGIYVRGGSFDQTEILMDGIPVFNPFHSGGFVSTFHTAAVQDVELISAGYPARFGGRLGSFMDIKLRNGSKEKWKGDAAFGLLNAEAHVEGPIGNSISLLASGRINTFNNDLDYFGLQAIDIIPESEYNDWLIKIQWVINPHNEVSLSVYQTFDEQLNTGGYSAIDTTQTPILTNDFKNLNTNNWGNTVIGLNWNSVVANGLYATTTLYRSTYSYQNKQSRSYTEKSGIETVRSTNDVFSISNGITDLGIKSSLDWEISNSLLTVVGLGYKQQVFEFNQTSTGAFNNEEVGKYDTQSFFVFNEWHWKPTNWLSFQTGLRYDEYRIQSESFSSLQPRISLRLGFIEQASLKMSYAKSAQFMHLLSNNGLGPQTDIWVPSLGSIQAQNGDIYAIGLAYSGNNWEYSLEYYYRTMSNVVDFRNGLSFIDLNEQFEDRLTQGSGVAYGFEQLLKKRVGKLNGFISYTLSWSNRTFSELNNGKTFPYKFDRRHNLSTNWNYTLFKNWDINATFTYMSGYWFSVLDQVTGTYVDYYGNGFGTYYDFSKRNNYRLQHYHRLDLSIQYSRSFTQWAYHIALGAYNVYNNPNQAYWDLYSFGNTSNERTYSYVPTFLFPIQPFLTTKVRW